VTVLDVPVGLDKALQRLVGGEQHRRVRCSEPEHDFGHRLVLLRSFRPLCCRLRRADSVKGLVQSIFTLAALPTAVHFSNCDAMKAPNSPGVPGLAPAPSRAMMVCISSVRRPSLIAALGRLTIAPVAGAGRTVTR